MRGVLDPFQDVLFFLFLQGMQLLGRHFLNEFEESLLILSGQVQVFGHVEALVEELLVFEIEEQTELADPLFLLVGADPDQELVGAGFVSEHIHIHPVVGLVEVEGALAMGARGVLAAFEELLVGEGLTLIY